MTWKFKKTKHYDKHRMFRQIEREILPEAFELPMPGQEPML